MSAHPKPLRVAIGIKAHSGWAAIAAVAGDLKTPQVLDRRRISVVDPGVRGANQPYHFAKTLVLKEANAYLERSAETSRYLAAEGLAALAANLRDSGFQIVAAAIVMASGQAIPRLAETLASHALIHTAEGEFFRNAFAEGCNQLGLRIYRLRERELLDRGAAAFRMTKLKVKTRLNRLHRDLGPPWTQDQKSAALAAWLALCS